MFYKSILMAIFCGTASIASIPLEEGPKKEFIVSEPFIGKHQIAKIRKSYLEGEYASFLEEKEKSYQSADLSDWIQMRENKSSLLQDQNKWEQKLMALQEEKIAALFACLQPNDASLIAEKIRFLAKNPLSKEEKESLSILNDLISKSPKEATNVDEKALIEIDLEYEYKALAGGLSSLNLEQQMALRMQKMDRMVAASRIFQDSHLKKAVSIAAESLDKRLAKSLDTTDLNQFAKSAKKGGASAEKRIVDTIELYQDKFSSLMQEISSSP